MDILPENLLALFSTMIIGLKRLAHLGIYDNGDEVPVKTERFTLENLLACFIGVDKEKFLTEAPLQRYLVSLRNTGELIDNSNLPDQEKKPVREVLPNGMQLTFVVSPCDLNGRQLSPDLLDDSKNDTYPYFMVFYSNPANKQGLVTANPEIKKMPLLSIFPEEFERQCSFTVDYPKTGRNSAKPNNEDDLAYLDGQCRQTYSEIQKLVKKLL